MTHRQDDPARGGMINDDDEPEDDQRRKHRRRQRTFLTLALIGDLLGTLALGFTFEQGRHDTAAARDAAQQAIVQDRKDNAAACAFFRSVDSTLSSAFSSVPTTAAGQGFRDAFAGLQESARTAGRAAACVPVPFVAPR